MANIKRKMNSKLKNVSTNKKNKVLNNKDENKNKMLMSFDDYYEKNVSKEDKREIDFEVELIEKLIEARKSKKYTQRMLAKVCNVKQPQIAKIESFKCSPQVDTLIRLLNPLGYTLKIEAI